MLNMKLPFDVICIGKARTQPGLVGPRCGVAVELLDRVAAYWQGARDDAALAFLGHDPEDTPTAAERLGLICGDKADETHVLGRSEALKPGTPG